METSAKDDGSSIVGAKSDGLTNANWLQRAFLSELPSTFLRVESGARAVSDSGAMRRELVDREAAAALQQHYSSAWRGTMAQRYVGTLHLTVAQAKLAKNYGLTRMDPYVRLRVGHHVYETATCYNGATNPHWNKTFVCHVAEGVSSIHLDIYDECSFSEDSIIASVTVQIPDSVMNEGQTVDDFYPLSGKQGTNKEGVVNLVMHFIPVSSQSMQSSLMPLMVHPARGYMPVAPPSGIPVYSMPPQPSDSDVQQLKEMFPALGEDVVRSVLVSRQNNKDAAVAALLDLNS